MMGGKRTFLLHKDDIWLTKVLTPEQMGLLFMLMLQWQNSEPSVRQTLQSNDPMVNMMFVQFAERFAKDEAEYQRVCTVRRENGRRGGIANATKSKQMLPKASKSIPIPSSPDNNSLITDNSGIEVVPPNTDSDNGGIKEGQGVQKSKWRYLSSATINYLKTTGQDVAEYKKTLLRQEVEALDMLTPEGVDAFVNKWGEHNPNSDTIAAELEHIFDVAARARNYVKKFGKNSQQSAVAAQVDFARFEEGKSYWAKNFTKGEVQALPFEVRKHVMRGGAVKRKNGKWIID